MMLIVGAVAQAPPCVTAVGQWILVAAGVVPAVAAAAAAAAVAVAAAAPLAPSLWEGGAVHQVCVHVCALFTRVAAPRVGGLTTGGAQVLVPALLQMTLQQAQNLITPAARRELGPDCACTNARHTVLEMHVACALNSCCCCCCCCMSALNELCVLGYRGTIGRRPD
jgi:hypothetical protein